MTEDYKNRQKVLVAETLKNQDIAICTALIPGRPAPVLITEDMVKSMKPGSVIVDMAVEQGGNCSLSEPGEIVDVYGVKILGYVNMPSRVAANASGLYAKNLLNFVTSFIDTDNGRARIDWEDDIIKASYWFGKTHVWPSSY